LQPILEMRGITKTFPGVNALSDVNLDVRPAEIHAVVGENGAGKSTLMKVLSGVYPHGSYSGDIYFEGSERKFGKISDSEESGIIIIHQELALVPLLSIAENIFLGHETATYGVINWFEAFSRTKELLKKVGLNEHPNTLITNLGTGKQQLVEIAKALNKKVKLLILDEPTSSLNETDSNALLALLMEFRDQGISSIMISHKLNFESGGPHYSSSRWHDGGYAGLSCGKNQRRPHHQGHGGPRIDGPFSAAQGHHW
jgi:putative multiple sugar transport system ATP-binding protein